MDFKEFFAKYNISARDEDEARDLTGFLFVMDYIYGAMTKEQALALMADYYDNADEIYNSIGEAVAAIARQMIEEDNEVIKKLEEERNKLPPDEENFHKA